MLQYTKAGADSHLARAIAEALGVAALSVGVIAGMMYQVGVAAGYLA